MYLCSLLVVHSYRHESIMELECVGHFVKCITISVIMPGFVNRA